MYSKECKWCKKLIIVEKQPNFASHVASCEENPSLEKRKMESSLRLKGKEISKRIVIKRICPRCECEFEIRDTESKIRRGKVKKYCSDKCSRSGSVSEETKSKISESLKNSDKRYKPDNLGRKYEERNGKKCADKIHEFVCLRCGLIGSDNRYNTERKYHSECWNLSSGGFREGSSNCKKGWYKGYWCDSSYELAYLIFNLEKNIEIERNKKGFEYIYNDKKHLFYPDFIVNGEYVEIKNYRSELTDCKLKYFPTKIDIYYKDTMKPYLEYVIGKYGKDFIKLYEDKRH